MLRVAAARLWHKIKNHLARVRVHPSHLEGYLSNNNNVNNSNRDNPPEERECPICLQQVRVEEASYCENRPCNAYYHRHCIQQWKEHNGGKLTCTLCTLETIRLKPKKRRGRTRPSLPNRTSRVNRPSRPQTIYIQPQVQAANPPSPRQVRREPSRPVRRHSSRPVRREPVGPVRREPSRPVRREPVGPVRREPVGPVRREPSRSVRRVSPGRYSHQYVSSSYLEDRTRAERQQAIENIRLRIRNRFLDERYNRSIYT